MLRHETLLSPPPAQIDNAWAAKVVNIRVVVLPTLAKGGGGGIHNACLVADWPNMDPTFTAGYDTPEFLVNPKHSLGRAPGPPPHEHCAGFSGAYSWVCGALVRAMYFFKAPFPPERNASLYNQAPSSTKRIVIIESTRSATKKVTILLHKSQKVCTFRP